MPPAADWTFIRFPQFQLALVAPQQERINAAASAQMVQAVCGVDAQVGRWGGHRRRLAHALAVQHLDYPERMTQHQ